MKLFRRPLRALTNDLWKLVGPTVQKNINQPLWLQFCAIYFEGLSHGHDLAKEQADG